MKGVLLVNMGGPQSLKEVKFFLKNMFSDKAILPFSKLVRMFLSTLISNVRYKKSWSKYLEIGGTPLVKDTEDLTELTKNILGKDYVVSHAFSYSNPLIKTALEQFNKDGINDAIVIPLYPHYSISTWQSVIDHSEESNFIGTLKFVKPFFKNNKYIEFFEEAIKNSIRDNSLKEVTLLFSAHSIPNNLIKKGDYYESDIRLSAQLIAEKLNLDYSVSFQSQIGKKWLGPITEDVIKEYSDANTKEILIIPLSFVGENLETLYDIDKVMINDAKKFTDMKVSRMRFSENQTLLAQALAGEVTSLDK